MGKTVIKWLGHAAFQITSPEGRVVLIDPWITGNPSCPIKVRDIEAADAILVTHDHSDHTGDAVDIAKRTKAVVACMPETADDFKAQHGLPEGLLVNGGIGMNIGGTVVIKGIEVTMVQAFHSSGTANPSGYIVKMEDGTTVYHAGDTGVFASMQLFAELYGIDVALLPIGGCFTMDAAQAAVALRLLNPRISIPMHYKTFPILEQSAARFIEAAKARAPRVKVIELNAGETHTLG